MRIGFVGAGSMASALARGLGEPALIHDVQRERAEALASQVGGTVAASNGELAEQADIVVLAHKPAQLEEVAREVDGRATAVASIVAATRVAQLEAAYPGVPVYRFIPNIPVEVGRGVFCYAPGTHAAEGPQDELLQLFSRCGVVIPLDEPLIEPAMALMSCGPAFLALVAESFASAGAAHGLDADDAMRMVVETMGGTAEYLARHDYDGLALRARVATPGGTTERGLLTLEDRGLGDVTRAAVDAVVEGTRR
jgi:pyrroline-5-carboxylate reductase